MKFDAKKIWSVVRPILTVVTNILMKGREAGLWSKKDSIPRYK